jgi:hypothetical protein
MLRAQLSAFSGFRGSHVELPTWSLSVNKKGDEVKKAKRDEQLQDCPAACALPGSGQPPNSRQPGLGDQEGGGATLVGSFTQSVVPSYATFLTTLTPPPSLTGSNWQLLLTSNRWLATVCFRPCFQGLLRFKLYQTVEELRAYPALEPVAVVLFVSLLICPVRASRPQKPWLSSRIGGYSFIFYLTL